MIFFIVGLVVILIFIGILNVIQDDIRGHNKQMLSQVTELKDENSKLIAYIDQNIGCATVCSDCHCGKKEMLE